VRTEYCTCNQCRDGCNERERHSLSPEGPLPKACFPNRFWVHNNIVKYDDKTNPSVWLEEYCLACRAGGADSDLFIIQFLPIYLADTSRAWLDHFPET
jgi:hypothetical protein